jgi:chromosome segregation ATPase
VDGTILPNVSNIPAKSLAVEVMPGKLHLTESNAESLRQEVEELKADRARLLESSTDIIKKIRQESQSQLKTEHVAREQVEAELAELKQKLATANRNLPEAADLLNQLKAKRRKSTVSLADVETLLEIIEGGLRR